MHPGDQPGAFTARVSDLLREFGWYSNKGWREKSDRDRGIRPGISAGQAVDELVRRDWNAISQPCTCSIHDCGDECDLSCEYEHCARR